MNYETEPKEEEVLRSQPILQVGFTSYNIFLNVLNVSRSIDYKPWMKMVENLREPKIVLRI
jgi:hypothetical protein